jgi:hypothetical protein
LTFKSADGGSSFQQQIDAEFRVENKSEERRFVVVVFIHVTMRNHHQQRRFQRDLCCKVENTGPSYP